MEGLTAPRVEELLERVRDVRVLVVGDLMLDRYIAGSVHRVSPEAPVPVVRVLSERHQPGGAANVAANVRALGARCDLIGCAGDDLEGGLLLEALGARGVSTDGIALTSGRATTVKTRVLAGQQQVVRFDRETEDDLGSPLAETLAAYVRDLAPRCDVLVVQDYNKGVLCPPVIESVLRGARRADVPTVVDPKRRNFFSYGGATVFKPNARELEDALADGVRPDDPAWMEATRVRLACDHLLVTLGAGGMALQSAGIPALRLRARSTGVFDVSGAGDTVTATVAVALAAGADPAGAAVLANYAASVEVAKPGVETVSPDEIRTLFGAHEGDSRTHTPLEERKA